MTKIVDQTEISATPRASIRQHLLKLKKISENIANFIGFYWLFRYFLKACGVTEMSDRSTIFGLWCHMSVYLQSYAYITLISENMIKNSKTEEKMCVFYPESNQNDISKFDMLICWNIKNHEKILLTWFVFYKNIS